MPSVRKAPQQRRSRERIELILATAQELLAELEASELTVIAIAERAGIPPSTVYRYFADRDAIVASVLDREMEALDQAAAMAYLKLERVTLRSLFSVGLRAHLEYHREHPRLVSLWFREPRSAVVSERVRAMDLRTGLWMETAAQNAGMVAEDAPSHRPDMLIRLCDRMLEFVLTNDLAPAEQDQAIEQFVDMLAAYVERWATPRGLEGIPLDEFLASLGPRPEHHAESLPQE